MGTELLTGWEREHEHSSGTINDIQRKVELFFCSALEVLISGRTFVASKGGTDAEAEEKVLPPFAVVQGSTAKRGASAGSQFWGCTAYPKCKGTRKASDLEVAAA